MNRRRFFGWLGGGLAAVGLGRLLPAAEASGYRWIDFGRGTPSGFLLPPNPLFSDAQGVYNNAFLLMALRIRETKQMVAYEVLRRGA